MKKLYSALLFIAFMILIYLGSFFIMNKIGLNKSIAFDTYTAVLVLFTLLGLTYNRLWQISLLRKRPFMSIAVSLFFVLLLTLFLRISTQSYTYFQHISTTEGKHWQGTVFQSDPVLGHKPVRSSSSFLHLEFNKTNIHSIPIKFDENGFRIPDTADYETKITGPVVLFLGCSFTEGADCYAEKTFPYLVGKGLNGTSLNAGTSSYGFAQMLILAKKLIPKYKPDYIVVQYSPWLAKRAISKYAPTYGLQIPSPYFAKVNDSIVILPPSYATSCFSLNWKYDKEESNAANFLSFYLQEGFSLIGKDLVNVLLTSFENKTSLDNTETVEKFFFDEVVKLSNANNSKLVVVNLGDIAYTGNSHKVVAGNNASFAEADSLLWKNVNFNESAFNKSYFFWGNNGKDSVIIDKHPTPEAHAIIANSILQTINKLNSNGFIKRPLALPKGS